MVSISHMISRDIPTKKIIKYWREELDLEP